MIIKHITISDFGSVPFYDTALTPELNIFDSHYTLEISAAIELILCSKALQTVPPIWIRPTTRLTAEVLVCTSMYTVNVTPRDGRLTLAVTDNSGKNAADTYRKLLSHCLEQDATESFDGLDKTLPLRLCWYRNYDDAPADLLSRTESLADTKTFRSHLIRYIKAFQPEPINSKKNYQTTIDRQGKFEVFYPGISDNVSLSETEERLFLYICFLSIAEFWADIEEIRDLHHEKKPLVIQNFLEFLDESTDISRLIARTIKLQRQVIILTPPLDEETKKKWVGKHTNITSRKDDFSGLLFKSGN